MNKTAIIYSKEEALAMKPKDRPMCYRVPSKIYHDAFEVVGSASLCWQPRPTGTFSPEEAENFTVDFLFKIAAELEKAGLTYENWPEAWNTGKTSSVPEAAEFDSASGLSSPSPSPSPQNILAPCPFCGGTPKHISDEMAIDCECGVYFGKFGSRERLFHHWNTRAPCPIKDEGEETLDQKGEQFRRWLFKRLDGVVEITWLQELCINAKNRLIDALRTQALEKPEASPATTGKGPMELSGLLDQIEQRAEIAKIIDGPALLVRSADDVPALVKALRRAVDFISRHMGEHPLHEQIAQLLNASSDGRATDEQGGLPVTPNSSSPALTQGAPPYHVCPECKAVVFHHSRCKSRPPLAPPALPLPLSEETKKDL